MGKNAKICVLLNSNVGEFVARSYPQSPRTWNAFSVQAMEMSRSLSITITMCKYELYYHPFHLPLDENEDEMKALKHMVCRP